MSPEIRAPIFIVGPPRSGTTVLYEKLARHPDVAWISNITKKVPGSLLATRAIMLFRDDHRPTEAKKVWARFSTRTDVSRGREDATPRAWRFLRRVVRNNLRLTGRSRFLSKDPNNSLRIPFLDAIFPDAIFVHILRDGRAVANSSVSARRRHGGALRGIRIPGWESLVDLPPLEAAGVEWKTAVETIRRHGRELPAERFVEIRYEDFTADPAEALEEISRRCGLPWQRRKVEEVVSDVVSQNHKWRETLSAEDVERLETVIGGLLVELGYR